MRLLAHSFKEARYLSSPEGADQLHPQKWRRMRALIRQVEEQQEA